MIFIQKQRDFWSHKTESIHIKAQLYFIVEKAIVRGVETNEHMNGMQKQHCISGVHFGCFILLFFFPGCIIFIEAGVVWCNSARQ